MASRANQLMIPNSRSGLGGGAPATKIAYVHRTTGNNATGTLNDVTKPYQTMLAAANALVAAYPASDTKIIMQSEMYDQTLPLAVYSNAAGASLEIDGAGAYVIVPAVSTLGLTLTVPSVAGDVRLHLRDVTISSMGMSDRINSATSVSVGTIWHYGTVTVTTLELGAPGNPSGDAGANGAAPTDGSGATGGNGSDGTPPSDGSQGGDFNLTCADGAAGGNGYAAWSISLLKGDDWTATTYSSINAIGTQGGPGGSGASNSSSFGGNGGNGGNALDDGFSTMYNGANGGAGGNCYVTSGNGGAGGNGGNGGVVTYTTGISVNVSYFGGMGGGGGFPGTANASPGNGGSGGNGINGGSSGNSGATGNAYPTNGMTGMTGSFGNDGSLVAV